MRRMILSVMCIGIVTLVGSVVWAGELETNYDRTICKYYGVKQSEVDAVRAEGLNTEDIPVAFHVAKFAKTSPVRVASMRARGDSWAGIVQGRNLSMGIFYVLISGNVDSFIYGPLLDEFRSTPERNWRQLQLSDEDVANLVNLKMAASHYDYNIFKVMDLRDTGKSFEQICLDVREARDLMIAEEKAKRRSVANAGM